MDTSTQLLFPHPLLPQLRSLRGPEWAALVDRVCTLPEAHEETLALMLTVVRLNGCLICEADSYRAMRGCLACAVQTLRRHKGTDAELLAAFNQALDDVRRHAARIARPADLPAAGAA